jgi:hypothetical protein
MASKVSDARDNRVANLSESAHNDFVVTTSDVEEACARLLAARPLASADAGEELRDKVREAVAGATAAAQVIKQTQAQKQAFVVDDNDADKDDKLEVEEDVQVDAAWRDLHSLLCANAKAIKRQLEENRLSDAERAAAEAELRRLEERRRMLEELARLEASARAAAEAELQRERKRQAVIAKLRSIGTCEMGFAWLVANGGFRCAGGSHFVTFGQLGVSEKEARSIF